MELKKRVIERLQKCTAEGEQYLRLPELQKASVLIPLFFRGGDLHVLMTVRSIELKHNAGEVCFPGGKSDRNDTDEIHTALREAEEEIGLPPVGVEVVCRFTPILNQRGLLVTPVVGFISESFSARPNPAEVSDVFSVPVEFFLKDANHTAYPVANISGMTHSFIYTDPVTDKIHQIWGLTASLSILMAVLVFDRKPEFEFTDEYLRRIPNGEWPRVIVVADGSCGDSCSVLGISSEYNVESCHAYGANATIERLDQRQVPTPEIRAHSLYFDLSAYGIDAIKEPRSSSQASAKPGFHLKIYGTFRNRYMALACTSADSKMMRFLRHTASSSIMKNIFHQSFNAYKTDIEPRLSELTLQRMQCSRKLFEIILSHRRVSAAYIEEDKVAVTVEGEAARVLNFDTGTFLSSDHMFNSLISCQLFGKVQL
uniref:Si:dkey-234i14.6 n=1 Tax=Astyanax mexicanus TaxID=7994 RepID=A0A3B1JYK4_ASTMX